MRRASTSDVESAGATPGDSGGGVTRAAGAPIIGVGVHEAELHPGVLFAYLVTSLG